MTTRMRRLLGAAAVLAVLLFLGRWTVTALAERWWGLHLSPAAGRFLTDIAILRGTLDLGGFVVAAAWTIGNLLVVYLAIGTVEVSRQIANLEVREALNPRALRLSFIVGGLVLGIILGADFGRHWPVVALAWQGTPFGVAEPILGHDAGLYVSQLPLWDLLRRALLVLVGVTLLVVTLVYVAIGAIRRMDGRPAINDHARRHLGWLLAAAAAIFAAGFLLEPFLVVGGARGPAGARAFQLAEVTSLLLTGVAVMVALASLAWAFWAKHFFLAAGWMVLAGAALLARVIAGSLAVTPDVQLVDATTRAQFDAVAYGLANARDTVVTLQRRVGPRPASPSLWDAGGVRRVMAGTGRTLTGLGPAWLPLADGLRPTWLVLAADSTGAQAVTILADDRTTSTGAPLFYGRGDSAAVPVPATWVILASSAFTPAASAIAASTEGPGVEVRSPWQRLALAWALQDGELLARGSGPLRVSWVRVPADRLAKVAPWADWGNAQLRLDGGRALWFLDGLVQARLFPLSTRARLASGEVGSMRAGFLGVVDAESGAVRLFARPEGGPLADAWTSLAHGVVEPWSALPSAWRAVAEYPRDAFGVQVEVLAAASEGRLVTAPDSGRVHGARDFYWDAGFAAPVLIAPVLSGSPERLGQLVLGRVAEGRLHLLRVSLDSLEGQESPAALQQAWSRFPTYAQVLDSVRAGGGTLVAGSVRYALTSAGLVATQMHYGPRGGGGTSVTWVSVAGGGRLGAGRSFGDAWSNLLGSTVPAPPGAPPAGVLAEARRWFRVADSTFRRGDFTAFGKAFEALRAVLDVPPAESK